MRGELDPNRLLFLRTVVEAGSISAGARALGVTQQAISAHLRVLERQVGVPVLLRYNRGVLPTDSGRALLAHADAIAGHLAAANAEIDEFAHLKRGSVRIAAYWSAMVSLIPQALRLLGSSMNVTLITADPAPGLGLLRDGRVDITVVFRFAEDPEWEVGALVPVEIGREPYHVIAPAGYQRLHADGLRLADLVDETWVVGCAHCQRHLVDSARAAGFTPRIEQQANDHMVAQAFVAEGLALSIMPQPAYDAFSNPRVVSRGFPELKDRAVIAYHRPGTDRVPSVAAALSALSQVGRSSRDL